MPSTLHRASGTGHWAPGTGTGHRAPAPGTGHRAPGTGHQAPGTGHRAPGTGHRAPPGAPVSGKTAFPTLIEIREDPYRVNSDWGSIISMGLTIFGNQAFAIDPPNTSIICGRLRCKRKRKCLLGPGNENKRRASQKLDTCRIVRIMVSKQIKPIAPSSSDRSCQSPGRLPPTPRAGDGWNKWAGGYVRKYNPKCIGRIIV